MSQPLRLLSLATGMLTVFRVRVPGRVPVEELRSSTALYPLVGLGIGVLPALALLLPLSPLPRAALALALWVAVTGALHLDGWADCCDAAFAPALSDPAATRERRLLILRDPHLGSFGAVGIVLLLLSKWSALVHAPAAAPLLAAPVGRWCMVLTLRALPPARESGLGATFAGPVPLGAATALLGALLLATWAVTRVSPLAALAGLGAGTTAAVLLARRFGGATGDVCGAAGETAELATLWALLPWGA